LSCQSLSYRNNNLAHKDLGSAIKELRTALGGVSQERFARKLGTTTRTVARWEAAANLSPRILSRLYAIATSVRALDAADFFESKIREVLDWEPGISENLDTPVPGDDLPPGTSWGHWRVTPVEHELVSQFLKRYRANDKAIQRFVEELAISTLADLELRVLKRQRQEQQLSLRDRTGTPEQTSEHLTATPPSQTTTEFLGDLIAKYAIPSSASEEQALGIVRALLLRPRPGGKETKE
jgi:transcriptional regulator with XRE-family HTH domain